MAFVDGLVVNSEPDKFVVVAFQQNEITREDFVRGARAIVGDQVLVQTIRQMHKVSPHLVSYRCR